ncbi:MAG: hydrogenase maturation protease [Fidelibacterota bacterium]|nr:MAG: hydrogenase maturation protease [Candidatus Neomarinimicrobiota bacterium]
MQPLVLGLGNDLIADDAVGVLAAREVKQRLGRRAHVVESSLSGLALLDLMVGYHQAVIIDAMYNGRHPPGSIVRLTPADLSKVVAPTPHFAGLPELFSLAKHLELDYPEETVIFAMEVEDPLTIGGSLSLTVRQALPALVNQVTGQIASWENEYERSLSP